MNTSQERIPTFKKIGRGIKRAANKTWRPMLAVIFLLIIAHSIATYVLGRKVEEKLAEIKARGEYISCAELAGPPIPDSENGALIYEQALKPFKDTGKTPAYNLVIDEDERAKDPSLWGKAETEIAGYKETIKLIREAQAKPKCRFKANWKDGFQAMFPNYARVREGARLLEADALVKAHNGDARGAMDSLGMLFKLQDSMKDEPTLIGILVRIALIDKDNSTLSQVAEMVPIQESDAKRLSNYLAKVDLNPGFLNAMRGERAFTIWTYDYFLGHPNGAQTIGLEVEGPYVFLLKAFCSRPVRPWFYNDELRILQYSEKALRIIARPHSQANYNELVRLEEPLHHGYGLISMAIHPNISILYSRVDTGQMQVSGSRIFLALNAYKGRFGGYPKSLDDLEFALGWKLDLKDVFSGKQFIYKQQGKGFILYSIGPNFKDDGGVPRPRKSNPDGHDPDDIVWKG